MPLAGPHMPEMSPGGCQDILGPEPSAFTHVTRFRGCRWTALKCRKCLAAAAKTYLGQSHLLLLMLLAFEDAVCRPSNAGCTRRLPRHIWARAICFYSLSRMPFASPQMPEMSRGGCQDPFGPSHLALTASRLPSYLALPCFKPLFASIHRMGYITPWCRRPLVTWSFGESFRFAKKAKHASFLAFNISAKHSVTKPLLERGRRHQGISPCYVASPQLHTTASFQYHFPG